MAGGCGKGRGSGRSSKGRGNRNQRNKKSKNLSENNKSRRSIYLIVSTQSGQPVRLVNMKQSQNI